MTQTDSGSMGGFEDGQGQKDHAASSCRGVEDQRPPARGGTNVLI